MFKTIMEKKGQKKGHDGYSYTITEMIDKNSIEAAEARQLDRRGEKKKRLSSVADDGDEVIRRVKRASGTNKKTHYSLYGWIGVRMMHVEAKNNNRLNKA